MARLPLLLFCIVLCNSLAQAQRSNYQLLWEVSGNGLSRPSYVFGSMHVRDEVAFQFPDSLLLCLASCDAFANEVHLDSAVVRMMELEFYNEELAVDSAYMKEGLAYYERAKVKARQNNNEDDSLDLSDMLESMKDALEEDHDIKEGSNMPTPLDAWLMEYARSKGQRLYGLENIDYHLWNLETEPFSAGVGFFRGSSVNLLKAYHAGDLGVIGTIIDQNAPEFESYQLTQRNHIMVESIVRIIQGGEALFAVVGVAHLPGEEGVVELLRERGFTLRPVAASFPTESGKPAPVSSTRPWPIDRRIARLYQFSMPLGVQMDAADDLNRNIVCIDIGRGLSYMVMSNSLLPGQLDAIDEVFFENDGYSISNKVPCTRNGIKGFRYSLERDGEDFRYYKAEVFVQHQEMYYLQVGAYESESLRHPDVERFFNGFKLKQGHPERIIPVIDTIGAFSVDMPKHFTHTEIPLYDYAESATNRRHPLHMYRAGLGKRSSTWLLYKDYAPAGYMTSYAQENVEQPADLAFDYLNGVLDVNLKKVPRDTVLQGFPVRFFSGQFGEEEDLQVKGFLLARGQRVYTVFGIDDLDNPQWLEAYLSSFSLLPYTQPDWTSAELSEDWSVLLPVPLETTSVNTVTNSPSAYQYSNYLCPDPHSGAIYEVEVRNYPALYSARDTALLLHEAIQKPEYASIIFEETDLQKLSISAAYFDSITLQTTQLRAFVFGRDMVVCKVTAPEAYFDAVDVDAFLQSPRPKTPAEGSLFEDHSEEILQLLRNDEWEQLDGLLSGQVFQLPQQGPALRDWLIANADRDLPQNGHYIREQVYLAYNQVLDGAGRTQLFRELPEGSILRAIIIETALTNREEADFRAFFDMLQLDETLARHVSRFVYQPFIDNLALTAMYWPSFQQLIEQGRDHYVVWELANSLLESPPYDDLVTRQNVQFIANARLRLLAWKASSDEFAEDNHAPKYVFRLLQTLADSSTIISFAQELLNQPDADTRQLLACSYLLEHGIIPKKRHIKTLLAEPDTETPLVHKLNTHNQLQLLPVRKYTQSYIADLLAREELRNIYGYDFDNLRLDSEIEIWHKGSPKKAFIFTFSALEDKNRLAVVGLFEQDSKDRRFLPLVNTTTYTVSSRRRESKARQLIEQAAKRSEE